MSFPFHVSDIKLLSKRFTTSSNLEIHLGRVTILVGPSNGGKSQLLKDIEEYCFTDREPKCKLISKVQYSIPVKDPEVTNLPILKMIPLQVNL